MVFFIFQPAKAGFPAISDPVPQHFPAVRLFPLQAIESFAVTVKDIAQMLQSFGTELAETELPDDGKDTEHLLETHTAKYRKLKVRRRGSSLIPPITAAAHTGS